MRKIQIQWKGNKEILGHETAKFRVSGLWKKSGVYVIKVDGTVEYVDANLIKKRAQLIKNNEKFSINILAALREIAEEREQSKSQEDIYAEESIYTKFTSNKDTALFSAWHAASWKDKLKLLDKFEDKRLVDFGKKIIYQEAPEILPTEMFKSIKKFPCV